MKTLLAALFAAVLTSCGAIHQQVDLVSKVNTSVLAIGMSKADVTKAMHKKPYNTVQAERIPDSNTLVEVVQYTQFDDNGPLESYWLYFANDKLERWELARPGHRPVI
ncbi:hypothetical protein [Mucilaginibacter agri]|uniref:Lipoprotein SmpA/OmlA domain-containing protein n=1 Tax=Mucilaginibacter agri TaxID=2695265 RepID=A0A965ZIT7_9SPHI|nr:hypothetical protein [Mucilaginibacter agri]NCD70502.1 hypothetical protein [Mucilaginibacter agri]